MIAANATCTACPTGCATCNSPSNCLTCSSSYTLQVQAISTQSKCVQCASPCSQCITNANTCTACISGYSLNGWMCVSNFNFGFQLTLGTTLASFYSNYANFLDSLAQIMGASNINQITMTNIQQGSVITTGTFSTNSESNSNSANNMYNSLTNNLVSGNSIGGMPIQSSEITVNGGSVSPIYSGPNLALILGISIPLGVLCNFIFYF